MQANPKHSERVTVKSRKNRIEQYESLQLLPFPLAKPACYDGVAGGAGKRT